MLYKNREDIGGFNSFNPRAYNNPDANSDGIYWSSSPSEFADCVKVQKFIDGNQADGGKAGKRFARLVRS